MWDESMIALAVKAHKQGMPHVQWYTLIIIFNNHSYISSSTPGDGHIIQQPSLHMAITRSAATYVSVVEYNVTVLWSVYHCYAWSCMFIAICFFILIVFCAWSCIRMQYTQPKQLKEYYSTSCIITCVKSSLCMGMHSYAYTPSCC